MYRSVLLDHKEKTEKHNSDSSKEEFAEIRPAVANVDQAMVIFAMESPKPNFLLLDRFLIMMEQQDVPSVICFRQRRSCRTRRTAKTVQNFCRIVDIR